MGRRGWDKGERGEWWEGRGYMGAGWGATGGDGWEGGGAETKEETLGAGRVLARRAEATMSNRHSEREREDSLVVHPCMRIVVGFELDFHAPDNSEIVDFLGCGGSGVPWRGSSRRAHFATSLALSVQARPIFRGGPHSSKHQDLPSSGGTPMAFVTSPDIPTPISWEGGECGDELLDTFETCALRPAARAFGQTL